MTFTTITVTLRGTPLTVMDNWDRLAPAIYLALAAAHCTSGREAQVWTTEGPEGTLSYSISTSGLNTKNRWKICPKTAQKRLIMTRTPTRISPVMSR